MRDYLIHPENMPDRAVSAFFTTRLAPDDMHVLASYADVPLQTIYLPVQKHTDTVQVVAEDMTARIADAVVTKRRGLLIGVKTADCVPILLYDPRRRAAGAVHAGWRSTAEAILRKTLAVFIDHFYSNVEDILVSIGPAICGGCYEVGPEVVEAVLKGTGPGSYISERGSRHHIDLRAANLQQALSSGVPAENIWQSTDCTFCRPEKYYSYRYAKETTGRLYGMIALKD
jgi:YfiH family protein